MCCRNAGQSLLPAGGAVRPVWLGSALGRQCLSSASPGPVEVAEALQGCCGKSLTLGSRQSPSLWGRVWGLTGGVCPLGARTLTALSASHSLHKVLFTEQPETYYKWDNWPPESDRK